jgi:hypothetical protein
VIGYRDFAPRQLAPPRRFDSGAFESFDQAVQAANDWISAERIEVVNVETVVLPLYSRAASPEAGTVAPCVFVQIGSYWFACLQFIRVWYRLPGHGQSLPPDQPPQQTGSA